MDSVGVGIAGIVAIILLIISGVPIGVTLCLVGALGFLTLSGMSGMLGLMATAPYQISASYELAVIPLFLLMGHFAYHSGLSTNLYKAARIWLGRFAGGLVLATIGAAAMFGACCGSSVASAAIFTKMGLPEMLKFKHDKAFASGALAAAGTLAVLIPPSTILVFYGILCEQSIGKLLIAGILPGFLSAILYSIMIYIRCKYNPSLAPPLSEPSSIGDKFRALGGLWSFPVLVIVVIGGIYLGIFTATEASALGAFTSFILICITRKKDRFQVTKEALMETASTTAMIFIIIIGALIFSRFLAISRLPTQMTELIQNFDAPRWGILCMFLTLYVFLGMILDVFGMLAITLPIIFPVIISLGYNPIWYGVIMVKMSEIGLMTPPVGINIYVVKGVAGNSVALEDVFRGAVPFVLTDLVTLALLVIFPDIVLYLPNKMYGQ